MQFKRLIATLLGINDNIFQGFNMYDHEWIVKEMIRRYAVNSHDVNIWLTHLLASLTWFGWPLISGTAHSTASASWADWALQRTAQQF